MQDKAVEFAGDPEQVAAAQKKRTRKNDIWKQSLVFMLTHAEGRRFLYQMCHETGVYSRGLPGSTEDAFFRTGKREIGMWILEQLKAVDPEAWIKILSEERFMNA